MMMDYSWEAAPTGQAYADDLGPVRQLLEQAGLWGQVAPTGFEAGGARDRAAQRGNVNWDVLQGYKVGRKQIGDNLFEAALADPTGKMLTTQQYQGSKNSWLDNVMEVAVPAALAWMGGTAIAGAGGAAGGAGTAAGGSGATNAALIDSALNSAGYGASSAGAGLGAYESAGLLGASAANTNATNPALIDSALGTPGYGASSAGAGGGAGATGGLFGSLADSLKKIGVPNISAGDALKLGGLIGGAAGSAAGSSGEYKGPMPTIKRGDWKAQVAPQFAPQPSQGMLPVTEGYQNSGLWRFLQGGKA